MHVLGRLAAGRLEWGDAERLHHDALAMSWTADFGAAAGLAGGAGGGRRRAESNEEAAALLAAAERARRELGLVAGKASARSSTVLTGRVRKALGAQAFEAAWAQGADLTPDEVVGWVRRARGSRERPSAGWESLTPTELEVVRHAAAGLTNPEIGERMFISRGTVKTISRTSTRSLTCEPLRVASEAIRRREAE